MDDQLLFTIYLLLLLFSSMWPHINLVLSTCPQKNSEAILHIQISYLPPEFGGM